MGDPCDNLWRDSVTQKFRIPKGTKRSSDILFEGEFQSIYLVIQSLSRLE